MDSIKVPRYKSNLSLATLEMGAIAWGLERFKDHTKQAKVIKVYYDCTVGCFRKGFLKKYFKILTDRAHITMTNVLLY